MAERYEILMNEILKVVSASLIDICQIVVVNSASSEVLPYNIEHFNYNSEDQIWKGVSKPA